MKQSQFKRLFLFLLSHKRPFKKTHLLARTTKNHLLAWKQIFEEMLQEKSHDVFNYYKLIYTMYKIS